MAAEGRNMYLTVNKCCCVWR